MGIRIGNGRRAKERSGGLQHVAKRGKAMVVRTGSICLSIKAIVYSAISRLKKPLERVFSREVWTKQGKPGELDTFGHIRG